MFKKLLIILVFATVLVGCKPRPFSLGGPPENAPPIYKKGWEEGCNSGLAVYGNDVYKAFYNYEQDVSLIRDRTYYKAWIDSFNYCRNFVNRYLVDGYWGQEGFKDGDMRNRKVMEGSAMGIGANPIGSPGWDVPNPGDGGITGLNKNFYSPLMTDDTDWLGRKNDDAPDWLGRTGENKSADWHW